MQAVTEKIVLTYGVSFGVCVTTRALKMHRIPEHIIKKTSRTAKTINKQYYSKSNGNAAMNLILRYLPRR